MDSASGLSEVESAMLEIPLLLLEEVFVEFARRTRGLRDDNPHGMPARYFRYEAADVRPESFVAVVPVYISEWALLRYMISASSWMSSPEGCLFMERKSARLELHEVAAERVQAELDEAWVWLCSVTQERVVAEGTREAARGTDRR